MQQLNNVAICVYTSIRQGTYQVVWYPGDIPVTVGVVKLPTDWLLTMPKIGWISIPHGIGTTFADAMRILLDADCYPGKAHHRHPDGRWVGVTKVIHNPLYLSH